MVYLAQNDSLGAIQYFHYSDYYGELGRRAAQMRLRVLSSKDNVKSHLTFAVKEAKDDLQRARQSATGFESGTMSSETDSSARAFLTLFLVLAGTPALLACLLKDWYRVGAKDPFSAPAPRLYVSRKKNRQTEDPDDSEEPPHDSLAEHFEQLKDKMRESLSTISSEQESTMDLGGKIAVPEGFQVGFRLVLVARKDIGSLQHDLPGFTLGQQAAVRAHDRDPGARGKAHRPGLPRLGRPGRGRASRRGGTGSK